MVKIEKISPGAVVSILRNGERITLLEKQLIGYDDINTLEVTGGDVVYSIDEDEVVTKSGIAAPAVPQAPAEPELAVAEKAAEEVKPAIVKPAPRAPKTK